MCCLTEPEWEIENIEGPDSITRVLKVLEPDAGKLARPVLRGGSHGNVTFLPDIQAKIKLANDVMVKHKKISSCFCEILPSRAV